MSFGLFFGSILASSNSYTFGVLTAGDGTTLFDEQLGMLENLSTLWTFLCRFLHKNYFSVGVSAGTHSVFLEKLRLQVFRYPPSQTLGLRGLWRMFPALKGGLCGTIYRPHFTILAEVVGELQQHALGDSERCRLNRAQGITTGRKERCFHYVVPL